MSFGLGASDFYSHFYSRERKEHGIFQTILEAVPDLDVRLSEGSEEDIKHIADLVRILPCCRRYIGS